MGANEGQGYRNHVPIIIKERNLSVSSTQLTKGELVMEQVLGSEKASIAES